MARLRPSGDDSAPGFPDERETERVSVSNPPDRIEQRQLKLLQGIADEELCPVRPDFIPATPSSSSWMLGTLSDLREPRISLTR